MAGHQKSIAFLEILHATCQNCFVFYAPFKTAFRHPFYPLVSLKGRYLYIINEHGEAIGRKLAQGVPMRTLTLDLQCVKNFKVGKNVLKYYTYTLLDVEAIFYHCVFTLLSN